MKRISASNTKPEELVRKYLFAHGFRYRKNDKRYPGKPDIVLPKYHVQIFVHGCFWHQHKGCKYAAVPKSNRDYWIPKLEKNVLRDASVIEKAIASGWKIIIVWECSIKRSTRVAILESLIAHIVSADSPMQKLDLIEL